MGRYYTLKKVLITKKASDSYLSLALRNAIAALKKRNKTGFLR